MYKQDVSDIAFIQVRGRNGKNSDMKLATAVICLQVLLASRLKMYTSLETKLLSRINILLTRGIHNCGTYDFEDSFYLGCDAMLFVQQFLTFPTTIMPSPPGTA
jgi:hypothetical protein